MNSTDTGPPGPKGISGLAIPVGLFLGIGIGMLAGEVAAGVMIGLGAGFLGMIVLRAVLRTW